MTKLKFSRRDFLKLSASGVLGLVLSELGIDHALAAPARLAGPHHMERRSALRRAFIQRKRTAPLWH